MAIDNLSLVEEVLGRQALVDRVVNLAEAGIAGLPEIPRLVKGLSKWSQDHDLSQHLTNANEMAEMARPEIEAGFPLLYSMATITTWGLLEATIRDFVVLFLEERSGLIAEGPLGELKLRVLDYERLPLLERVKSLLDQHERETVGSKAPGVARFDPILGAAGIHVSLDADLRKDLIEFAATRHLLVHRGGVADLRYIQLCPWLQIKVSDKISVNKTTWLRFRKAVARYTSQVLHAAADVMERYDGKAMAPQSAATAKKD